ncbi:MAG: HEAT repeat domain-containing protein [Spirochaetales bacterium]|nr:HEAT repeat domain-containing protein [Spirochaetales bacterium]
MKKISILAFILTMLCGVFAFAAEGDSIEDALLSKKEQRIKMYLYQAKVGDMAQKMEVLDKILSEFNEFNYSADDKRLVELVTILSEEGSTRKEYENGRLVNNFPDVRRKAVKVLAKLGGDQSRDALVSVLLNDEDTVVKAEACLALSEVGDSQTGEALRALVYVYRKSYNPDPNFVKAVIQSIKAIAKSNSSAYSDAIFILSEIQLGNYNREIREAAYRAVEELSKS